MIPSFGRESWIWYLGIVSAVLVYLSQSEPPASWDYAQWIQAAAFVVATISAKLSLSPLARGDRP